MYYPLKVIIAATLNTSSINILWDNSNVMKVMAQKIRMSINRAELNIKHILFPDFMKQNNTQCQVEWSFCAWIYESLTSGNTKNI